MSELGFTIPVIWSSRFLANLDMALVYGSVANRDYQPDAQFGSAINIHKFSDITIGEYSKYTSIGTPEAPTVDRTVLTMDQQPFFNVLVDSIDEMQTQPDLMNEVMKRAAYGIGRTVDAYIAGLYTGATVVSDLGTAAVPVVPVVTDIYQYLTMAALKLDEANVPVSDRFIVMDPAGVKLLKDSGEMLSDTPAGDTLRAYGVFNAPGQLPMGYKGRIANFDIFMSNQTPVDDVATSVWLAGHPDGIAFADSFNEIKGYDHPEYFGDAVKGLYVYGAVVNQPDAIVPIYTALA